MFRAQRLDACCGGSSGDRVVVSFQFGIFARGIVTHNKWDHARPTPSGHVEDREGLAPAPDDGDEAASRPAHEPPEWLSDMAGGQPS
jgi:hypothetical protein